MTLLRQLRCWFDQEPKGMFIVKTKKWWWFHKLFRTKQYRNTRVVEKILLSKQDEFMKDFTDQYFGNILYGTPICLKKEDEELP